MAHDPERRIERLDALLAALDPVERSKLDSGAIEEALDELGAALTARPRARARARRRRSIGRRRSLVLIAAAAAAIGAGVATATVLSAHTGRFPTKAEEAMGGPGEALNPAAPDYRAVALEVASDIPYPAGFESWRDFLISDEIRTADGGVESVRCTAGSRRALSAPGCRAGVRRTSRAMRVQRPTPLR